MLKESDIEIQTGRAEGGDFLKVVHKPTGISRREGPPLRSVEQAKQRFLREIEAELVERGLFQYVVPDRK
jgi:hypothetical protein